MLTAIKRQITDLVTKDYSSEAAGELISVRCRPRPGATWRFACLPWRGRWASIRRRWPGPLAARCKDIAGVAEAVAAGPTSNLSFTRDVFARQFVADVLAGDATAIKTRGSRVLIEHTSINPNASPHVGRGRNAIIGDTIARLFRFMGHQTEVHYYVNDIGKQIALLVYACRGRDDLQFNDLLDEYVAISQKARTIRRSNKSRSICSTSSNRAIPRFAKSSGRSSTCA
jgi:hypothetical protein